MSPTSEEYLNKQPKKGGVSHAPMSPTSDSTLGLSSVGGSRAGKARPRLKFKAHSLLWRYKLSGPHRPQRGKFRSVKLRNWERRIWYFEGSTVVCNLKTAEIWLTSRSYSSPQRMLACSRMRADLIRRRFSKWQEVALELIEAKHPEGIERAHLVIDEKRNGPNYQHLKGHCGREDSMRIGMKEDESHKGNIELDGPESPEGAVGADHVFLEQPRIVRGIANDVKEVLNMVYSGTARAVSCSDVERAIAEGGSWPKGGPTEKRIQSPESEGEKLLSRGGLSPCFTEMVLAQENKAAQRCISIANWGRWARAYCIGWGR